MCELASVPPPTEPSIIVYQGNNEGGRLGTRMTVYATLLVLHWNHGVNVLVDKATMDLLNTYFTMDSGLLPALEEVYCPGELAKLLALAVPVWKEQETMERMKGHVLLAFPSTERQPNPHEFKQLWFAGSSLYSQHRKAIRRVFGLRDEFNDYATNLLRELQQPMEKTPVFVGVHARRTDYQEYARQVKGERSPGPSYYRSAMDYYMEEYEDDDNSVVFLMVSDDMDWVKARLGGRRGLVLAGTGDPGGRLNVGRDLAVLAAANHSIRSQGNFGDWASYLAGGDVYTTYGPLVKMSQQ